MASQTDDPIPTVHANEALRSLIETFFASPPIPDRTERIVEMESGVWVAERTRKVAEQVKGASTCWDSIGTRRDMVCIVAADGILQDLAPAIELRLRS